MPKNKFAQIGYYSAILVAIEVASFGLLLIANLFLKNDSINMLSYLVCFFLAPTFITMMTSVYYYASTERKIFAHLGLVFATIYGVMISIAYYLQLTVVRLNVLEFSDEIIKLISYEPGSAIFSLNILGYTFMSLAVFVIYPIFSNKNTWLIRILIINGIIGVTSIIFPALDIWGSSQGAGAGDLGGSISLIFWSIIFVPIPIILASIFKGKMKELQND